MHPAAEIAVVCLTLLAVLGLTRAALWCMRTADDDRQWDDEPTVTLGPTEIDRA